MTSLLIMLTTPRLAWSQNRNDRELSRTCRAPKLDSGRYKLLFTTRGVTGDKTLILYILLKSEDINRGYLLTVAERINKTYCNEASVIAAIFDERKYAGTFAVTDFAVSRNVYPGYRGQYRLNRQPISETLMYSSKKGNPIDEVEIDLRK